MTSTLLDLIAQFRAFAPNSLTFEGAAYKLAVSPTSPILVDEQRASAIFAFLARKAPGAFVRSKLAVAVRYDAGADLYDLVIVHADGSTLATREVASVEGWFTEDFERLADLLVVSAAVSAHERAVDLAG